MGRYTHEKKGQGVMKRNRPQKIKRKKKTVKRLYNENKEITHTGKQKTRDKKIGKKDYKKMIHQGCLLHI